MDRQTDPIAASRLMSVKRSISPAMQVTFWGVRGSIASPGPATVRYGGNTTCIEVRTDAKDLLILDAGTGIYPLSRTLQPEYPLQAHLLLTHSHWDHIQGLPFFEPNFVEGNLLHLYGPAATAGGKGVGHVLDVQLQHNYFPVLESQLKGRVEPHTLKPGERIRVGSAWVTPYPTCHPVASFGYRIEADGKSLFFTGDHEQPEPALDPAHPKFDQLRTEARALERLLIEGMSGVDLLIADSSYTSAEYPDKRGWGHGTFQSSLHYAACARVGTLVFTHHEPTRSDDDLEAAFTHALQHRPREGWQAQCLLAKEGLRLSL